MNTIKKRVIKLVFFIGFVFYLGLQSTLVFADTFPIRVIPFTDTSLGLYWNAPADLRNAVASTVDDNGPRYHVFRDNDVVTVTNSSNLYEGNLEAGRDYEYRIAVINNGEELASTDTVPNELRYEPVDPPGEPITQQDYFLRSVTGPSRACMLDRRGYVQCWGDYYRDQLVRWPSGVTQTSLSNSGPYVVIDQNVWGDGCGIKPDGTLQCFDSIFANPPQSDYPFVQVSVNGLHVCAIDSVGTLQCWGNTSESLVDIPNGIGPFTKVSTGSEYNCALDTLGSIHCWGPDWDESTFRTAFPVSEQYVDIGVGANRICGLKPSGDFTCINNSQLITLTGSGMQFLAVSADQFDYSGYMCGLDQDGFPHCWSEEEPDNEFFGVPNNEGGFNRISVSANTACASRDDDSYLCWDNAGIFRSAYPEAPVLNQVTQYGETVFELSWHENLIYGEARADAAVSGYEVYRNGEFYTYTTGTGLYEVELTPDTDYVYEIYPITSRRLRSEEPLLVEFSTDGAPVIDPPTSDPPLVSNNTISWQDDGWYQVQSATDYATICEGGISCVVVAGSYIVINHTTGERFENVVVSAIGVTVTGMTIYWPDDGWYQVQSVTDYSSVCEGGLSCSVNPGVYNVINHTTGERFENIEVVSEVITPAEPSPPANAILYVYSSTAVEIIWDSAPTNELVVATEVLRNGVLLGVSEGHSFYDGTRQPNTSYQYSLIAVDVDGNRSEITEVGGLIEQQKLTTRNAVSNNLYGNSVSIDGDTLVVAGRISTDIFTNYAVSAYVHRRNEVGTWVEAQTVIPNSAWPGGRFGSMVLLQDETLLVWGDRDNTVYVFTHDAQDGIWTESQQLTAFDDSGQQVYSLGNTGAIDGDTLMLAGSANNSVYVFARDASGNWVQTQTLHITYPFGVYGGFGSSVSLDGNTALIGAEGSQEQGFNSGSVYVYVRDDAGVWQSQQTLLASDGTDRSYFGAKISMVGDTAVIGSSDPDFCGAVSSYRSNTAYVFTRADSGQWNEVQKLQGSNTGENDHFGNAVAFDGETIVVGAISGDGLVYQSGAAYVFRRNALGQWIEIEKLAASDGVSNQQFGQSVAVDGETVLVGADAGGGCSVPGIGSAYVFSLSGDLD